MPRLQQKAILAALFSVAVVVALAAQSPGGEAGAVRLVVIAVVLALAALMASEVLARRLARGREA